MVAKLVASKLLCGVVNCKFFSLWFNFSVMMMEEKLDDEHSGVILLGDFLEEFFPKVVKIEFCVTSCTLSA